MCDAALGNTDSPFAKNTGTTAENVVLPFETIKELIDDVSSFSPVIAITSREPLLHPDIIRIIYYVKENNLRCHLTTNGVLLSDYAEDLVKLNLDHLSVSIDGPEEIHENIRGKSGVFKKIISSVEQIKHYKQVYKLASPEVEIVYTISGINSAYLTKFLESINGLGVSTVSFLYLNYITEIIAERHNKLHPTIPVSKSGFSNEDVMKINAAELWKQLDSIKKSKNYDFSIMVKPLSQEELDIHYNDPEKFIRNKNRCKSPWVFSQITARGEVVPRMRCYNIVFGNIKDSSFKNIWNNRSFINFRKELRKSGVFPACFRCSEII